MKYVLVIPDGCADEPQEVLGGLTPLAAARTPHMDAIAAEGVVGRSDNVPASLPSGSDVATMNLFGYDALKYHTGRAPLEAAAQGIELGPLDWAVRCNLVTVTDGTMTSFTAGQIPNALGRHLIEAMQEECGSDQWEFHAGVSYRNLLIHRAADGDPPFDDTTRTAPPHDLTDGPVADYLPSGKGAEVLRQFMQTSEKLFATDEKNQARAAAGELAASGVWLWGQGSRPSLEPFATRYGKTGAVITAVDLLRGIGRLLGWRIVDVPGATGYLDTDYAGKGAAAIETLADVDFVVVHVEASDEASHEGDAAAKVEALEQIDRHIVGPVHQFLKTTGDYRILVSPDHPTFLRTKTHAHGFVPFAMCGTRIKSDSRETYDEVTAAASEWEFVEGWKLMREFLGEGQKSKVSWCIQPG